ncbi:DMT family transporter [Roseburia sp. MSJ-14]|uniref:DMT family transporter n=1 Tax=Roseburia sp. MSJ-14 TaxID=2841514 RepID=UPI001C0F53F9|nr:DMT family transporter [Roseburia sp. MSJ-14]MBU5473412.1 DMT family transporter [Roseburia sp. MSJ-14]
MSKLQIRNTILLFLTAFIWGTAFVAQSVGNEYLGPFTYNCVRSLIGGAVLIPCIWFLRRVAPSDSKKKESPKDKKQLLLGGILCGICLCLGSNFQQMGIAYTTVGKAGFITAFYIIIVPVLGLFLKKKCTPFVWIGVGLALAGLYFLCITKEFSVGKGDMLVLICAFLFAIHILVIDYFTEYVDGVKMSCIQFLVCGILSAIPMFLVEKPQMTQILSAWQPILYGGVLSCGVAYTLQIVGQKGINPTVASLILSMESVISVLAGLVVLHQQLSKREVAGCVLMFCAIILAQLPQKKEKVEQGYEEPEE